MLKINVAALEEKKKLEDEKVETEEKLERVRSILLQDLEKERSSKELYAFKYRLVKNKLLSFKERVQDLLSRSQKQDVGIKKQDLEGLIAFIERSELLQNKEMRSSQQLLRPTSLESISLTFSQIRWQRGDVLGKGAYGTVYLGLDVDTGQLLAVKSIPLQSDMNGKSGEDTNVKAVMAEIALLRDLDHRNIVRYIGSETRRGKFNVFLEYVPGGSISKFVSKFGKMQEKVVRMYTRQILLGLEYLHVHRIVHRDIKGANILVDHSGTVKLADFGCSKEFIQIVTPRERIGAESIKGTTYWMAPEVILGQGHRKESDIWSVACVVIEMATGKPPFYEIQPEASALYHIGTSDAPPSFPVEFSESGRDFLTACFQRDPRKRPSAEILLAHPWVSDTSVLTPRVLSQESKTRANSSELSITIPSTLPTNRNRSDSSSSFGPSPSLHSGSGLPHLNFTAFGEDTVERPSTHRNHGHSASGVSDIKISARTKELALLLLQRQKNSFIN